MSQSVDRNIVNNKKMVSKADKEASTSSKEDSNLNMNNETTLASRSKNLLFRHVTILNWLPKYSKMDAVSDAIAGFTVGLTMVPQSIAYASLAGLSTQYGLYSAFMGSYIYVLFGTIKEVSIGPTSLMALMVLEYTHHLPIEFVFLLAFLAGTVEFLMGILNLGFLVDFISAPVRSGFTSATALIVSVSQLKGLLGLRFSSHGFLDNFRQIANQYTNIRLWDAVLGFSCSCFLLTFKMLTAIPIGAKDVKKQTPTQRGITKALWFISISRNALIVLITSTISYKFISVGVSPFLLSRAVKPGLPPFGLPPFSAEVSNVTYTFVDMCSELGSAIFLVPVVATLANVAIAKAFSSGKTVDATQEMLTLGLCNIFGSFVQAMPTCGAFTRSAVSNASGARTPLVGLYSGTIILLALSFLTPYFAFIPRATLSSVLICAVIFMVEWEIVLPLWRSNKYDFFLLVVTFTACLYSGVEVGLLLGISVNLLSLLYLWARPRLSVTLQTSLVNIEYVMITPEIGLFYPSVNFLHLEITKAAHETGQGVLPVVINCHKFTGIDYTIAMGFDILVREFDKRQQPLIFFNVRDNILELMNKVNIEFQYCNSEEELIDLLVGDKLDLARSETLPLIDEKPTQEVSIRMGDKKPGVSAQAKGSLYRAVLTASRGSVEKCGVEEELRRRGSFAE